MKAGPTILILCVFCTAFSTKAEFSPGLYFDPGRNGHGLDLRQVGQRWVLVLYSYDLSGEPEWLLGTLDHIDGELEGSLEAFDYDADRTPPQSRTRIAGDVRLRNGPCNGHPDALFFEWSLDGEQGLWCVQPLLDPEERPAVDFSGLWYAGDSDVGWGTTFHFGGNEQGSVHVVVVFFYGANGQPVWALGSSGAAGAVDLQTFNGYCRNCESMPLVEVPAGSTEFEFVVKRGFPRGILNLDVSAGDTSRWVRQSSEILPLSEPARGLIPLPDSIDPNQPTLITDTSVVTMADDGAVLEHHSLLVEQGLVRALGEYGSIRVPENAVRIDGRDLFVGPGLHDMHTHFTFGGVTPMLEAGTLFIANGVTTVLNMGDGGMQNLPGTDAIFGSGERIGPTVYAGAAAYGTADGRAPAATVTTPAQATAFAEQARRNGYQFIKLYNALSPSVVQQFIDEGERLGMPVNGHLPKTMSMAQALDAGQTMIAHVAEIYFTLLANQPNEALLAEAAAMMLEHDVYLTDTLTASESFAANYGGNEANFLIFSRRNGIQYQPTTFAERGWRNFFESSTLQPPGSFAGQLDNRYAFFQQMVRYFNDAGVRLILGTDSPGHIGVISGFSVHENLRIYREIGLSPFDAYSAATRNPGSYLSETLELVHEAGVVVEDARADLLLLSGNPLESMDHLRRPVGVMTRGRFYSKTLLDDALTALDEKYRDPFSHKLEFVDPKIWCTHEH